MLSRVQGRAANKKKQLLGPKPRILPLKENKPGSRGFTEKVREETARAKRFRGNSYGSPASSLLLVAWRLKKNGAPLRQGRFNRASASEPCFRPEAANHGRGAKTTPGSPKPQRGHAKQGARQGGTEPGTTRFRDGRTTTRPPAPRRGPAAPAAQARASGADRESAQVLRVQILAPNLDLSSEADSEARKTHAELKNKLQEAPVLGAPVRPFWL